MRAHAWTFEARRAEAELAVAWMLSLGVHVGTVIALAMALGRSVPRDLAPGTSARLVFVEPAPPPAPPLGAVDGDAASSGHAADADLPLKTSIPPRTGRRAAEPVMGVGSGPQRRKRPATATTRVAPRPAPARPDADPSSPGPAEHEVDLRRGVVSSSPPDAVPGRGVPTGLAGGAGDVVGGAAAGVAGGIVGGLGTTILTLRDVLTPPVLVDRVLPEYPRRVRREGVEGEVVLEVIVNQGGRVEEQVRVLKSVPLLDALATAAVRRWRFRPARDRSGVAARVVMEVPLRFVLHDASGARREGDSE